MKSKRTDIWQVDAFTDQPFAGNPAAVCILPEYPSEVWMQQVAAEMNLAETTFVVPLPGENCFGIRWFTPAVEVDLCGHATLAAVHVLLEQARAARTKPLRFESRSGELICHASELEITLDFPATPPQPLEGADLATQLAAALGIEKLVRTMRSKFDLLAIAEDEHLVRSLVPEFSALSNLDARGIIVSAASDTRGIDFVSRFFAPRCGISEDPVTGSAHCCLAPYWAKQLGRNQLTGYQASARGGTVKCDVRGDRVLLCGSAVTVLEGKLLLSPD